MSVADDRERPDAAPKTTAGHRVEVYAMPDCPGWTRALTLLVIVRAAGFPGIDVRIVDLSDPETIAPDVVVASPTWLLDGRRIALGNSETDWLLAKLGAVNGGG